MSESVARSIEEHISQHPPDSVTLPWRAVDGAPVTASLIVHRDQGRPINRNDFNRWAWRPALDAAGVPLGRVSGMHALRPFYASVFLDAGESVKALSEYLGHPIRASRSPNQSSRSPRLRCSGGRGFSGVRGWGRARAAVGRQGQVFPSFGIFPCSR
ncbi:hypothetical protein AB0N19_11340 [Streptomyces sp. NPDC051132]|uniref:hypothetical protein n=1 Tax=Streptomyces sp. NPDC051132 TaxID=3155667 RepID=UPI00342A7E3F